ncbi:EGF [Nesidiocoris tenuis]|uniref:EGF n=1 Tax=Nesidiocoris tenuis TaxID=355587 RepID=A0ABN7B329_9HEMI|nr:EGF [Nesidiocoris tenuis]
MKSKAPYYFIALFLLFCLYLTCDGCDPEDMVYGCRISQGQCLCGRGCHMTYRYENRDECRAAIKGESQDSCSKSPCANNGVCIQTPAAYSKFKCRCEGTGFYGPRCQYACPRTIPLSMKNFPYECVEI